MFDVTFLGHQGWLLASENARVLVDPLLVEEFGHRGCIGRVFPPRIVHPGKFPSVDAVVLTHEHDDHFSLPSLHRISRSVPIYVSERSSMAARTILSEMGFGVNLVGPGNCLRFAELAISFFSPDQQQGDNRDEWDVLPFFVHHEGGHGSFFSAVDVSPTDLMLEQMRQMCRVPGLWCFTNNAADWSFLHTERLRQNPFGQTDTLRTAGGVIEEFRKLSHSWASPAGMLFCGGGYSFAGEREWLNRHVFPVDSARALRAIAALEPDRCFLAPLPGQTIRMRDGRCTEVHSRADFVTTLDEREWPDRRYSRRLAIIASYEPACGVYELGDDAVQELTTDLDDLAAAVYASTAFRGLYSFPGPTPRKPTFALVLLADAERAAYVFEYEPQSCKFVLSESADPEAEYVAGVECWASDLHALFRGHFGPLALCFGRMRSWNVLPDALRLNFASILVDLFHPLRRPEPYLALYRSLYQLEPPAVPQVRGRSAPIATEAVTTAMADP